MGVESDRLVFDYLSRVGDLAQTALPAAQRMQLVARLRNDIDSRRGSSDSPATVRRILGRIGTPDEVVEAAAGRGSEARQPAEGPQVPAAEPAAEPRDPAAGSYGPFTKGVPGPRGGEADWWQIDRRGGAPRAGDEIAGLPGMTGGVFISFDEDEDEEAPGGAGAAAAAEEDDGGGGDAVARAPGARRLPGLGGLRRLGTGWGSPMLLVAAALLLGGAAVGSLVPLALGWGVAYLSRALTRTQAKFAVLGIPGAAAAGLVIWVWGRDTGHWGTPIAHGQMGHAFQHGYPVAIRLAAVASALYVLWRARRRS